MSVKKKGLGRGLDLLIPDEARDNEDAVILKISQIEPNRSQPRKVFDEKTLDELAASIKEYGIIQPIVVTKRDDYYEIIAGERRWRAARKAGLSEVPVVVREYTDKEIAEISLIENIQREDLSPVEEANAYKQLIDGYGLTQEELAGRIGKSRAAVANTMRLLKLDGDILKMLEDGSLSEGAARALLSVENDAARLEIAKKIIGEGLSVRQAEDLVRQYASAKKPKRKLFKKSVFYKDIEKKLTEALGAKVSIKQKEAGDGRIEIRYSSEEELDRLFFVINGAGGVK